MNCVPLMSKSSCLIKYYLDLANNHVPSILQGISAPAGFIPRDLFTALLRSSPTVAASSTPPPIDYYVFCVLENGSVLEM